MLSTTVFYRVDKFGMQIKKEDCIYHWGRIFRKRGDRGKLLKKKNNMCNKKY